MAALSAPASAWAQDAPKPETSQFDFSLLDDWLTSNDLFFVREHYPAPAVSEHGWKLSFSGRVAAPYDVSHEELVAHPRKSLTVTLECAENPVGGGLVSTAEWEGASLAPLIERARPLRDARFVRLWGADVDYARIIPLAKALEGDTLLAHRMNGERLPVSHGFPVRAVVAGWYGMDSVKWLQRIELMADSTPQGFARRNRNGDSAPVTAMIPKAAFARPLEGAILFRRSFVVRGAAWAGERAVGGVDVSTDGGRTWAAAVLADKPQRYAWVRWQYSWKIPRPGSYQLVVRARDDGGRAQPAAADPSRLDPYEQNAWQKVRVRVV